MFGLQRLGTVWPAEAKELPKSSASLGFSKNLPLNLNRWGPFFKVDLILKRRTWGVNRFPANQATRIPSSRVRAQLDLISFQSGSRSGSSSAASFICFRSPMRKAASSHFFA